MMIGAGDESSQLGIGRKPNRGAASVAVARRELIPEIKPDRRHHDTSLLTGRGGLMGDSPIEIVWSSSVWIVPEMGERRRTVER